MSLRHRLPGFGIGTLRGTVLFLAGLVVLGVLGLVGRDEPTRRWRERRRQVYYENSEATEE